MAIPCLADSDCIHLEQDEAGALSASPIISAEPGNLIECRATGLFGAYAPPLVSALPGTPFDGQVVMYGGLDANGTMWQLRYNAASLSPYKWEWVGGGDMYIMVLAAETRAASAYAALTTPVELTLPGNVAGDYQINHGCALKSNADGDTAYQAVKLGAAAATNNEAINSANANYSTGAQRLQATGLAASAILRLVYASTTGTSFFQKRWLGIRPIRLGAA